MALVIVVSLFLATVNGAKCKKKNGCWGAPDPGWDECTDNVNNKPCVTPCGTPGDAVTTCYQYNRGLILHTAFPKSCPSDNSYRSLCSM